MSYDEFDRKWYSRKGGSGLNLSAGSYRLPKKRRVKRKRMDVRPWGKGKGKRGTLVW